MEVTFSAGPRALRIFFLRPATLKRSATSRPDYCLLDGPDVNMLIEFGDAFEASDADVWSWFTEAGFRNYEISPALQRRHRHK
jgi:hypothetical protein